MARRNLARTNSVAQSDLGVIYHHGGLTDGDRLSGGSEIGSEFGGGFREARDVVRSSVVNPVMVKTIGETHYHDRLSGV